MKKVILALTALSVAAPVMADTWVNGYARRDGTYVPGHYRSSPDSNPYNNYSTRGNVNPYTGQYGTRTPEPTYQQYTPQRCYTDYAGNTRCY